MVEVRLRVRLAKGFAWTGFFVKHPDLVVEAVNRFVVDPRHIVVELRIPGTEEHDWTADLQATPAVVSVQPLARSGRPNMYRVKWKAPAYYPALLEKYDLVGVVPFRISLDQASLSVALSRPRLQKLVRELRRRGFGPEILEMRHFGGMIVRGALTPKQRERFRTAVEMGFFDVPRRVSIGELSRRFSVRKSAFAESLALARRKILVAAGELMAGEDQTARAALFGMA